MTDRERLSQALMLRDGRSYTAYRDLCGCYDMDRFKLHIDHVQADPFAAPSRLRVCVPARRAGYPQHTYSSQGRAIALCTYLIDEFAAHARRGNSSTASNGKSPIAIAEAGQQLLERNAMQVSQDGIEARFTLHFPARGRRVAGERAVQLLCECVPNIVENSLFYSANDPAAIAHHIATSEDAHALRAQLKEQNLIAFIADGSILPRRSGIDDRPLQSGAVPFNSPQSLRVHVELPHAGTVAGMGIRPGVTLLVGGGFHGKSTLLRALSHGVYNHRPNDGRHLVACDESAVSIRAEDGRSVSAVDISPFINGLPLGRSTAPFTSDNASGSTSQAANIVEAVEVGARVLLVDEDTAAANFMVRDARMQQLITNEPITPLVDRVRALYEREGVSTILVIGGNGAYLDVADCVISMDNYQPYDVTQQARTVAAAHPNARPTAQPLSLRQTRRIPQPGGIDPRRGKHRHSARAHGLDSVMLGREKIDMRYVAQLVDSGQTQGLARALLHAHTQYINGQRTLVDILDSIMADIAEHGLDCLDQRRTGDLVLFRRHELAAAINRLRSLCIDT